MAAMVATRPPVSSTHNPIIGVAPGIITKSTPPVAVVNLGLPIRLVIPKLKIDAKVGLIGLTSDGTMGVPNDVTEAGWYMYGAHPGDKGSAVIGGHLNGVHGEPGIFLGLKDLRIGDTFSVIDDRGENIEFVVRQIRTYKKNEQPNEVFRSEEGSHVNLITCSGTWNKTDKRFSKRLVVFADKAI